MLFQLGVYGNLASTVSGELSTENVQTYKDCCTGGIDG
jgi:hypothetical protein